MTPYTYNFIINNMSDDEFPEWDNMPKPHPIMTLSWEDVFEKAKSESQIKFKRDPARDEVDKIFQIIKNHGMDCEFDTFWDTVERHVTDFYNNVEA